MFLSIKPNDAALFNSRDTYIEREQNESANDRNDRAIRVSAKWYTEHLSRSQSGAELKVVLLTNDRSNREKAEQIGVMAYGCMSS